MSKKNTNNMPSTGTIKKRVPTACEKLEAVRLVWAGHSKASVARKFGYPESTLRGWCKNPQKIIEATSRPQGVEGNGSPPAKRRKSYDEPLDLRLHASAPQCEDSSESSEHSVSSPHSDSAGELSVQPFHPQHFPTPMSMGNLCQGVQATRTTVDSSSAGPLRDSTSLGTAKSTSKKSLISIINRLAEQQQGRSIDFRQKKESCRLEEAIRNGEIFLQSLKLCTDSVSSNELEGVTKLVDRLKFQFR